ncbi:MAG: TrkA family potassium uptake protein [Firmicutes bacterium]|nr:TrkA family potassium uptake protein [Bacillota bacterium]MBQ1525214.1 TrkA family potassium uptake protein [Bacillota bacterium]MBQ1887428.1 TrkA family potassium uptake protein [Bacillota bacterium]MBQ2455749.1 TrkA family potassium uptake protein [Bacillota bacterium]MBQ3577372.1 TrkA family potassium uptake protein [Bacillota bacterium]
MKSVLVIGTGNFGTHLTRRLAALGNEIMIVDKDERPMEDLLPIVAGAKIGDCTDLKVLQSLDVPGFDVCFVCIGGDFQANLEITSQLKDLGAKQVISKANKDLHAKFLKRNGADEVVYPDRDIAEKTAVAYSSDQVFDFIELADGYSIYEIAPEKKWVGKTIQQVGVRSNYRINIVAVKTLNGLEMNPRPDYVFKTEEHLLVLGHRDVIAKLVEHY